MNNFGQQGQQGQQDWTTKLNSTFSKYWGYKNFRQYQLEACLSILQGRDTMMIASTGSGKSVIYQLPSLVLRDHGIKSTTLVISPLISLIEDQISSLRALGIHAGCLTSSVTQSEENKIMGGEYPLIYTTPEKISHWRYGLIQLNKNAHIVCIAIDESHCVSEWGHDFRPEFRQLHEIRNTLLSHISSSYTCNSNTLYTTQPTTINKLTLPLKHTIPILALTATATIEIQQDIITNLHMNQPIIYRTSFNRDNLKYYVRTRQNGYNDLIHILNEFYIRIEDSDNSISSSDVGIGSYLGSNSSSSNNVDWNKTQHPYTTYPSTLIYVNTIKETEEIATFLQRHILFQKVSIASYHASLSPTRRKDVHHAFIYDKIQIIIATIAFGMGIHKPDIRLVINLGLPKSIESYYQQSGRAGRDQSPSFCVLLYNRQDIVKSYHLSTHKNMYTNMMIPATSTSNSSSIHLSNIGQSNVYNDSNTSSTIKTYMRLDDIIHKRLQDMNQYAILSYTPNVTIVPINTSTSSSTTSTTTATTTTSIQCRRQYLLHYFGELYTNRITRNCCDLCDERYQYVMKLRASSHICTITSSPSETKINENTTCISNSRSEMISSENRIKIKIEKEKEIEIDDPNKFNVGKPIYLLLLTILDCGEYYGITLPIDMLCGSHNKSMNRLGNYTLYRTYGLGLDYSKTFWRNLSNYLVDYEHLLSTVITKTASSFSYERYKITQKGKQFIAQYQFIGTLLDQRHIYRTNTNSNSGTNNNNNRSSISSSSSSSNSNSSKHMTSNMSSRLSDTLCPEDSNKNRHHEIMIQIMNALKSITYDIYPTREFKVLCIQECRNKNNLNVKIENTQSNTSTTLSNNTIIKNAIQRKRTLEELHGINTPKGIQCSPSTAEYERNKLKEYKMDTNITRNTDDYYDELYHHLYTLRQLLAEQCDMTTYNIISLPDLKQLLISLPIHIDELVGLPGWGQWKIQAFGKEFCEMIREYLIQNKLDWKIHPPQSTTFTSTSTDVTVTTSTSTNIMNSNTNTNTNTNIIQNECITTNSTMMNNDIRVLPIHDVNDPSYKYNNNNHRNHSSSSDIIDIDEIKASLLWTPPPYEKKMKMKSEYMVTPSTVANTTTSSATTSINVSKKDRSIIHMIDNDSDNDNNNSNDNGEDDRVNQLCNNNTLLDMKEYTLKFKNDETRSICDKSTMLSYQNNTLDEEYKENKPNVIQSDIHIQPIHHMMTSNRQKMIDEIRACRTHYQSVEHKKESHTTTTTATIATNKITSMIDNTTCTSSQSVSSLSHIATIPSQSQSKSQSNYDKYKSKILTTINKSKSLLLPKSGKSLLYPKK